MSVLGFDIHVDKENAAPGLNINRRKALNSFGSASGKQIADRNRGKSAHLAQRKALTDVINDPASRNTKENRSTINKDEFCSSLQPSCKVVCGAEDLHGNLGHTERDYQKTVPPLQQLKVPTDLGSPKSKSASSSKNQKVQLKPKTASKIIYEDDDTDATFPSSERLSSYVNRLLTWRPPCLFGALPDSESDNSDLEQLPEDDILLDMQLPTPTVPEFSDEDLVNLMNDLPPQNPEFGDERGDFYEDKAIELALDQTVDTSYTFGSLHVMDASLEIPESNSSTDLDLSAT
ncbi:hypothetical protein BsWGS_04364 [Bradybaena similaris]